VDAHTSIMGLCDMSMNQERVDRYEISKFVFSYKLTEGSLVNPHVIKMMGHIQSLDVLGFALVDELAIYVNLQTIPPSYESLFELHMNSMEKILVELHGMHKIVKESTKRTLII
jgi:hydrogenase maturation factor HypE